MADAKEMKRLLTENLDFPDENIEILMDDAATLQFNKLQKIILVK